MSHTKSKRISNGRRRQKASWTPFLLVLGGLLLILLASLALRDKPAPKAAVEVPGAPSLRADKEEIDLGNMKFNQLAEVSFQLSNVGDETLRFTKEPYIEVVEGC